MNIATYMMQGAQFLDIYAGETVAESISLGSDAHGIFLGLQLVEDFFCPASMSAEQNSNGRFVHNSLANLQYDARFFSQDPVGVWGDPGNWGNSYAYVGNSPVVFTDPSGMWLQFAVGAVAGCAFGTGVAMFNGASGKTALGACGAGAGAGLLIATGNPFAAGAGISMAFSMLEHGNCLNDSKCQANIAADAAFGAAFGGGAGKIGGHVAGKLLKSGAGKWKTRIVGGLVDVPMGAAAGLMEDGASQLFRMEVTRTQCDWDEGRSLFASIGGGGGGMFKNQRLGKHAGEYQIDSALSRGNNEWLDAVYRYRLADAERVGIGVVAGARLATISLSIGQDCGWSG